MDDEIRNSYTERFKLPVNLMKEKTKRRFKYGPRLE